jgi:predicted ATPase
MKRFILTGTSGAGKTAVLRQLELDGFSVIEEAATDVIVLEQARGVTEPWTRCSFIDSIVDLQRQRQVRASYARDEVQFDEVQFHDRSVICTAALAVYLGYPVSSTLARELERIQTESIFQKRVFFIRSLGFITPTPARRITFAESLHFERVHEETYRNLNYEIVPIEPGGLSERVAAIKSAIRALKA